jgi:hypothetical protein
MQTVEQYRKNARDCRELAKRADQTDGDRQTLERLAKAWEKLADLRERDIKLGL